MTITKYLAIANGKKVERPTKEELETFLQNNPEYSDGGTVTEEVTEPAKEAYEIASWRVKHVLKAMGLIGSIEAAINDLPEPPKALVLDAWNHATTIDKWSATVGFIQTALGLTDNQVDAIFNEAENLPI
jgi:hypothetical protein